MRLRHNPAAAAGIAESELVITEKAAIAQAGRWQAVFPAVSQIYLEIGMGRGRFLLESAKTNPRINYLGLDMHEEMVLEALEKCAEPPVNLRFLCLNAQRLDEVFAPGEVARIYLNFPDPWPKTRHNKRRLTAPELLEKYWQILPTQGEIWFKTDDEALFSWSLDNFRAGHWQLLEHSLNLPLAQSNVVTEYESRFRREGKLIFFLRAART